MIVRLRTREARAGMVLAALASGFVMAAIDATVMNVAAPAIESDLHTTVVGVTWVVDAYVLTFASLLLLGGGLANRYGSRRIYLVGMAVFWAGSLCCAIAPSEHLLIAARLLQGLGAALFMPSSLSLLVQSFPEPGRRATMLGLWSAMVAASSAVGPTIGGLLTSTFGWRSIFLINVPVVAAGAVLTLRAVAADRGTRTRIAPGGHALVFLAVASGAYLLIEGNAVGFAATSVRAAGGIAILATILVVLQQRRTAHPVMPWELFRRQPFTGANVVGFLYSGALYGNLYLMGLFLQNARHASPFTAGLQLVPMTICFPLANVVYSRIHHRVADATIMGVCLAVAGLATLALSGATSATPYWFIAVTLGIANSGAGLVTASMTAATVSAVGDEHANHAGAVLNTNRQLGVLVGVALIGVILHGATDWYEGLHLALTVVATAYLVASAVAITLVGQRRRTSTAAG